MQGEPDATHPQRAPRHPETGVTLVGVGAALPGEAVPGMSLDNKTLAELSAEACDRLRAAGGPERPPTSPDFPLQRLGITARRILDSSCEVMSAIFACAFLERLLAILRASENTPITPAMPAANPTKGPSQEPSAMLAQTAPWPPRFISSAYDQTSGDLTSERTRSRTRSSWKRTETNEASPARMSCCCQVIVLPTPDTWP